MGKGHLSCLPVLLGVWMGCATGSNAQLIVNPNQFSFQGWDGNLYWSTDGGYPGQPPPGYAWTPNWGSTPSATVLVPFQNGLRPGWHAYDLYMWIPQPEAVSMLVEVAADGNLNPAQDGEPWPGKNGSQLQVLQVPTGVTGWVGLGPGPNTDPALGGYGVWINGSDQPFLEMVQLGFQNAGYAAFGAIDAVPIPEPSLAVFGLLAGLGALLHLNKESRAIP